MAVQASDVDVAKPGDGTSGMESSQDSHPEAFGQLGNEENLVDFDEVGSVGGTAASDVAGDFMLNMRKEVDVVAVPLRHNDQDEVAGTAKVVVEDVSNIVSNKKERKWQR